MLDKIYNYFKINQVKITCCKEILGKQVELRKTMCDNDKVI